MLKRQLPPSRAPLRRQLIEPVARRKALVYAPTRKRLVTPEPVLPTAADIRQRLEQQHTPDPRDADRWRALITCPGLRVATTTPQPHNENAKEPGYRYMAFEIATHGYGSNYLHVPDLIAFADYLIATREDTEQ